MSHFSYINGELHVEQTPLREIAAHFGTPTYVYSKAALIENFSSYADPCKGRDALICYAMKANSNLAVLNLLAKYGAGFDLVSGGELLRVIAAGGDPGKCLFSGVGKSRDEIALALTHNILCFNVESVPELHRLNDIAGELGKVAPVSLRINPNVDAKTHPYIATGLKENKFGIDFDDALQAYRTASALPHLSLVGIDCHIGSQLLDDTPLLEALDKLIDLIDVLHSENISLHHIDLGGGIGIAYSDEKPVAVQDYVNRVFAKIDQWRRIHHDGKPIKVIFEPGRSVVGNAGILLTKVEYLKPGTEKNFCIVDAAMNDLLRPAMYQAWMGVQQVIQRDTAAITYDVVGPVCESGDWLARSRALSIEPGDLLAIMSAGAYGMTMASNYNTRGRAAEVMIDDTQAHLIRRREKPEELFALESVLK